MMEIDGWVEKPLSEIADITSGQSPDSKFYTDDEVGMPFLQGCAEFTTKYPVAKLNCLQIKKVGKAGSILFSVRAPVGKINIADRDYIIGRGLASILATAVDPVFLGQYIAYLERQFHLVSQGSTFEAINSKELSAWLIGLPCDPNEQTQIAIVLSTLDQAIEQTELIIDKQQRIKAGLMQDLLTKGIDEKGIIRSEATHEFKDSPLGRIPVEWEVTQLSELAEAIDPQPDHRTPAEVDDGIPYIGISDFNKNGSIDFASSRKISPAAYRKQVKSFVIEKGDFVFGKIGTIGLPKMLSSAVNYALSANVILLKPKDDSTFVYWWMVSPIVENLVAIEIHSTSQPAFGMQKIRSLAIPKMTIDEQHRIGSAIDGLAKSTNGEEVRLAKLRRLKTGLMHDLLTGKVRVNDKTNINRQLMMTP